MYLTDKLRKNIFLSLCVIVAVALNFFETVIGTGSIVPGIKIGISNIVVLLILYVFGFKDALLLSAFKSILTSLLFGTGVSFIYSLCGGLLSVIMMAVIKKLKGVSSIGISMSGSFMHITAQIFIAFIILNSKAVFYYYPVLLSLSVITGFINGYLVNLILKKISYGRRN